MPTYDFSKIRLRGTPIRGFGGVASGPAPLKELLDSQKEILDVRIGQTLTSVDIVDMMKKKLKEMKDKIGDPDTKYPEMLKQPESLY